MGFDGRRRYRFRATQATKLAWLRERRARWLVDGAVDEAVVSALAREMVEADLYGQHTPFIDVRWSVRGLVTKLAREAG